MTTRRAVLCSGLAFASLIAVEGFAAPHSGVRTRRAAQSINALLVDETIQMPHEVQAFIEANLRMVPTVGIRLDAPAQAHLTRLLGEGCLIAGFSSGATLFCLERMAWDHGFRLAGRNQMHFSAPSSAASLADVAAFVAGAHPSHSAGRKGVRDYRPSRTDGMLHAWIMRKSGRAA